MPIDAPVIDPTTRAIIAFIEVGVVGGVLILLITGKFRHDREIKREELATSEANARTVAVEKQRDDAIGGWKAQTTATNELGTTVKLLVAHVERLAGGKS